MTASASLTRQPSGGSMAATRFTRRSRTIAALQFRDESFSFETSRAAGSAPYGGSHLAEVLATARVIRDGDEAGWFTAWRNTAERVHGFTDTALKNGHRVECPGGVPAGIELLPNRRILRRKNVASHRGACSGAAVPPDVRQRNQFDGPSGASHGYPLLDDDAARLLFLSMTWASPGRPWCTPTDMIPPPKSRGLRSPQPLSSVVTTCSPTTARAKVRDSRTRSGISARLGTGADPGPRLLRGQRRDRLTRYRVFGYSMGSIWLRVRPRSTTDRLR